MKRDDGKRQFIKLALFCLLVGSSPALAANDYSNSSHGNATSGVDRSSVDDKLSSYSPGNCAHCHLQHASLTGGTPSANASYTAGSYMLYGGLSGYAFCSECHDGNGPATDNVAQYYGLTYGHGKSGMEVECSQCHSPHQVLPPHTQASDGNLAVSGDGTRGAMKGSSGVEPDNWPSPIPLAGSEPSEALLQPSTYTVTDPVTKEYQVCFKCHSNYNSGPVSGLSNQAAQFNPNNYAHHPVTGSGQWRNQTIRTNLLSLKAPWNSNLDARMHCSDCHGQPTGSPQGPHGSNTMYMLKAWGHPTNASAAECYDNLCLLCHHDDYDGGGGGIASPWSHGSNSAHQYEGDSAGQNTLGCRACHGGPAGKADFTGTMCASPTQANGGRVAAIHGEKFMWENPATKSGKNCLTDYTQNPADHFLMGGYLTGIKLDNYHSGSDGNGTCWASGSGSDPCGSMGGGQGW